MRDDRTRLSPRGAKLVHALQASEMDASTLCLLALFLEARLVPPHASSFHTCPNPNGYADMECLCANGFAKPLCAVNCRAQVANKSLDASKERIEHLLDNLRQGRQRANSSTTLRPPAPASSTAPPATRLSATAASTFTTSSTLITSDEYEATVSPPTLSTGNALASFLSWQTLLHYAGVFLCMLVAGSCQTLVQHRCGLRRHNRVTRLLAQSNEALARMLAAQYRLEELCRQYSSDRSTFNSAQLATVQMSSSSSSCSGSSVADAAAAAVEMPAALLNPPPQSSRPGLRRCKESSMELFSLSSSVDNTKLFGFDDSYV